MADVLGCNSVLEFLKKETGRFDGNMYRLMLPRSFWVAATKKGPWLDGYGKTLTNITFKPRAPAGYVRTTAAAANAGEWRPMFQDASSSVFPASNSAGGSCNPTPEKIVVGSTTATYYPEIVTMEGPEFCLTDLRYTFEAAQQLQNIMTVLTDYATIKWEFRYRHEYLRLCKTKVVVGSSATYSAEQETFDAINANCPGSRLTQGVLDKYYLYLSRRGAADNNWRSNGAPVFTLVCDPETSQDLILQNEDLRQDIRYAEPNELLTAIGHDRRVYKGFLHMLDLQTIRYTCSQGTYTEVDPYLSVQLGTATACGTNPALGTFICESIVNPDWEAAPYTTSMIWNPDVFTSLIPKPITSLGPLSFNMVNYTTGAGADLVLLNIPDRTCNPRGLNVYHHGALASASAPVRPDKGLAFVHLRCDPALNLITACS